MTKTVNADGTVIVPLLYPVTGADGEIAQLILKRLKGKQFRAVNLKALQESGDEMLKVIAQLAGIESFVADQLDAADITELSGVVSGFFGSGPTTGGAS